MLFFEYRSNVLVDFNEKPLLSMDFKEDTITIDIQDTSFFDLIEIDGNTKNDGSNFWDMRIIHNARDFAEELKNKKLDNNFKHKRKRNNNFWRKSQAFNFTNIK